MKYHPPTQTNPIRWFGRMESMIKAIAIFAVPLTLLVCLAMLVISIYPGALEELLLITFLMLFPPILFLLLVVGCIVVMVVMLCKKKFLPATGIFVLLFGSYLLLDFHIPQRIAFLTAQTEFEQMLPQATSPEPHGQGTTINRRLGLYTVDEYALDTRGGVYFRVFCGSDGIGPDRMSYGFVYKPNRQGTPFGAAHYELFQVSKDWYEFCASDDWY